MMMDGSSSSNGYRATKDEGVTEEEGGCLTPKGGATDTAEERSCNKKKLNEGAPEGVETNRSTNSSNTTCMSRDDDTSRRDVEASIALVGRGIPDKHASHGTRCEFMALWGAVAQVRITKIAEHMKVPILW
jgi:hypothetical protein